MHPHQCCCTALPLMITSCLQQLSPRASQLIMTHLQIASVFQGATEHLFNSMQHSYKAVYYRKHEKIVYLGKNPPENLFFRSDESNYPSLNLSRVLEIMTVPVERAFQYPQMAGIEVACLSCQESNTLPCCGTGSRLTWGITPPADSQMVPPAAFWLCLADCCPKSDLASH